MQEIVDVEVASDLNLSQFREAVDPRDEVPTVRLVHGPNNPLELRSCTGGGKGDAGDGVAVDDEELEGFKADAVPEDERLLEE